jgi:hypothetical protein
MPVSFIARRAAAYVLASIAATDDGGKFGRPGDPL